MSRKWRRIKEGKPEPPSQSTVEALKRRRNRRLIFLGLVILAFPVLEVIAYRFRAITMTIDNRTVGPVTNLQVTYPGGSFQEAEIKPGGEVTRVTRPDFTFTFRGNEFSTYPLTIRFNTADGGIIRQLIRAGALDYSATETYTIQMVPPDGRVQLKHTTSPGFPLNVVRDLLARLGFG
jgi:hypothetical protein